MVKEVWHAREQARLKSKDDEPPNTRKLHPELAATVKKARQAYARGLRSAEDINHGLREYADINEQEEELHQQFHSGRLERQMIEADKEFGHGQGTQQSMSTEQLANFAFEFKRHSHVSPLAFSGCFCIFLLS